jgi:hypothetical protein
MAASAKTGKRPRRKLRGKQSRTHPLNIAANEKRSRALQLRAAGLEFTAIARQVGYADRASAYVAVKHALEEADAVRAERAAHYRDLLLHRLGRLHLPYWQLALGTPQRGAQGQPGYMPAVPPDPKAARMLLKIYDKIAMLMGLDPLKGIAPSESPDDYAKAVREALAEIDEAMPAASETIDADYTVEKDGK